MNVGETLKRARLKKQLTIEQLAQQTKINRHALEALEENDLDRLPADVYVRGFIRTYAREVDVDPEEVVADHVREVEQQLAVAPSLPDEAALAEARAKDRALKL